MNFKTQDRECNMLGFMVVNLISLRFIRNIDVICVRSIDFRSKRLLLEEVVATAGERSLQETPVAVSAFQ